MSGAKRGEEVCAGAALWGFSGCCVCVWLSQVNYLAVGLDHASTAAAAGFVRFMKMNFFFIRDLYHICCPLPTLYTTVPGRISAGAPITSLTVDYYVVSCSFMSSPQRCCSWDSAKSMKRLTECEWLNEWVSEWVPSQNWNNMPESMGKCQGILVKEFSRQWKSSVSIHYVWENMVKQIMSKK